MQDYKTFAIERKAQVATVTFMSPPYPAGASFPWELGCLMSDLREDNSIRVIVLTGSDGNFTIPSPQEVYDHPEWPAKTLDPRKVWRTFTGIIRFHQGMAEIEKPVIAKVNGDAIGFGSSIAFACDFIIAREDAVIMDSHMGATFPGNYNGQKKTGGHEFANVPGDGGCALIPLFMTPCKAKEYLMLFQSYTAAELAQQGIINYAVPAAQLDAKVDDIVQRLLQRGAYALARTKRLINRGVVEQLNRSLDAAAAYEIVTEMQTLLQPGDIHKLG